MSPGKLRAARLDTDRRPVSRVSIRAVLRMWADDWRSEAERLDAVLLREAEANMPRLSTYAGAASEAWDTVTALEACAEMLEGGV